MRIARLADQAARANDVDQVRGYEGAAAAAYWQALVPLAPADWGFIGRRHRPAPDPLNALLSFAYTLLLQEIVAAVHLTGLDVQFGALHPPEATRPSLAPDLEEPLRPPGVDAWVFAAVRGGVFRLEHFQREGERMLLEPAGRRVFFAQYEQQLSRRAVRHPLAPGQISVRQAIDSAYGAALRRGRCAGGAAVALSVGGLAYDIADDRRRARAHRVLCGYGVALQESVFLLELSAAQWALLRRRLGTLVRADADRVQVWPLCAACVRRTQAWCGTASVGPEAVAVV